MNYRHSYSALVLSRQLLSRQKGCGIYYESHHILPKSLFGNNSKENKVLLTAREHFIAHQLLIHCYAGIAKQKMISALWQMCIDKNGNRLFSSIQYEYAKFFFSQSVSARFLGKPKTERAKTNMMGRKKSFSEARQIVNTRRLNNPTWHSEETKVKIKHARKKQIIDGVKIAQSRVKNGTHLRTDICRKKMSDSSPNKKQISQFSIKGAWIADHVSLSEAAKAIGVKICCISGCLNSRQKTSGGFVFKYKNAA